MTNANFSSRENYSNNKNNPIHFKPFTKNPSLKIRIIIRCMLARDMLGVMDIENCNSEFPWNKKDFSKCLQQRECFGMVAEHSEGIVGFLICEIHNYYFYILNNMVRDNFQRKGIGMTMVRTLISGLSSQYQDQILLKIRETNLGAQIFLREQGFRAISVIRDSYSETTEDAYLFQYCNRNSENNENKNHMPKNRISWLADIE